MKQLTSNVPLPSNNSSWPWEPRSVLERNGAKSTMISRKSGQTDPKAASSCCVNDASLVTKELLFNAGTLNGLKTMALKKKS